MLGLGNSITNASYHGLDLSGFSMSFDASNADGLPQIGLTFTETTFDISPQSQYVSFDTGSNPLLNNATKGRTSKKYFKIRTLKTEEI